MRLPLQTSHQHEALKRYPSPLLLVGVLVKLRLETNRPPLPDQPPPVASLGRRREVPIPKGPDAILRYAARLVRVGDEVLDCLLQVGKVSADLDEVRVRTGGLQRRVMGFLPLELVRDEYRAAVLEVLASAGEAPAFGMSDEHISAVVLHWQEMLPNILLATPIECHDIGPFSSLDGSN